VGRRCRIRAWNFLSILCDVRRHFHLVLVALLLGFFVPQGSNAQVLFGPKNQRLEVSKARIAPGEIITVIGKRFDPEVGLYLSFCKIPSPGAQPTPCGSINMQERSNTGYWISSNAPSYAKGLTIPFKKNGSFKVKLKIDPTIGDFTCSNNQCAVTVRADHLRTGDRSHDLFIPIRFKR
jgi:hypothetical protein